MATGRLLRLAGDRQRRAPNFRLRCSDSWDSSASARASAKFSTKPAMTAVMHAAIGRKMASNGPSSEYVIKIEVTLVSGVEIKNDSVAPRLAPFLRNVTAAGNTPQEQSGNGAPTNAASKTERGLREPSQRRACSPTIQDCNNPAIPNPIRM